MCCPLSKAGLPGLTFPEIFAGAHYALLELLLMSTISVLNAHPFLDGIRAQYADLYDSSGGAMRSFMWHKHQEDVSDCLTAILQLAEI